MSNLSVVVPTLHTKNLRLRRHQEDDLAAYIDLRSDSRVYRFTTGRPLTEEEVWMRITAAYGHWAIRSFGNWAIEEKSSGRFIGEAGFVDSHRAHTAGREGVPEAGWWIGADMQQRGLGAEAAAAIHTWADRHLNVSKTFCGIIKNNAASLKVALGNEYEIKGEMIFLGEPAFVLERRSQLISLRG